MRKLYAVEVTEENIDEIVAYAKKHEFNLADHLYDNVEVNAEYGWTTYVIVHTLTSPAQILYFDDVASPTFSIGYAFNNGSTRAFSTTGMFKEIVTK